MAIDRSGFKFGAHPSPKDPRNLKLANYLIPGELPPIPESCSWSHQTPIWTMLGNDQVGNCTVAAAVNKAKLDAFCNDSEFIVTDKQVIDEYFKLTGGVDSGLPPLAVLNHWRKEGILGHKIGAFVQVPVLNINLVKTSTYLFGGLYSGLLVPESAMSGRPIWDRIDGRGLWGHCTWIEDYGLWGYMAVTWGMDQPMTKRFYRKYYFETWAVLSEAWIKGGDAPNGFKADDLRRDLQRIDEAGRG